MVPTYHILLSIEDFNNELEKLKNQKLSPEEIKERLVEKFMVEATT